MRRTLPTRAFLSVLALLLLAAIAAIHAQSPPQASAETFSDRAASALLRQLSESLQAHSKKNFLVLFDLQKMKNGPLFRQQIDSFFAHVDTIKVHMNLVETNADAESPSFVIDAEMELQPRVGGQASRRNQRVTFTVAHAGNDWKIIDVLPRSFFSLP